MRATVSALRQARCQRVEFDLVEKAVLILINAFEKSLHQAGRFVHGGFSVTILVHLHPAMVFRLGHAAFLGIGAYTTAILTTQFNWPVSLAFFAAIVVSSFVAFIMFLDQKIVKNAADEPTQKQSTNSDNKPVIDFYDILPQREVEIPVSEKDQAGLENPSINKEAAQNIVLQVGSFQSAEEADSLKAELAFLGLEASVKTAEVSDETWHRVQLGPFASNTKLSRAKNLLIENNIKYMQRNK